MPKGIARRMDPAYLGKLYLAQNGLCFHCRQPVNGQAWDPIRNPNGWTRDHVFPRSSCSLPHNIVIACQPCNGDKGARQPTAPEIERTKALYAKIGLVAFEAPPPSVIVEDTPIPAEDPEPVPPPLGIEARAALSRIERYIEIAGDRIDRGVPYTLAALKGLLEQFTEARARELCSK